MALNRKIHIAGFSLIELMIVVAIMLIVAMTGFPSLMNLIHRSKIEASARQVSTIFQVSKLEAIKTGRQTAVIVDVADKTIQSFVNVDESVDREFNPDDSKIFRTVDYELRFLTLPAGIEFKGPTGPGEAIDGFVHPDGGGDRVIFSPNGSVEDEGAYRIGDDRGNFLEVRVSPEATARIELKKWDPDATDWIGRREGDKPWKWY